MVVVYVTAHIRRKNNFITKSFYVEEESWMQHKV